MAALAAPAGPERTLVRARAAESAYEAWARAIRGGNVVVSNGPLVELNVDSSASMATARAQFYRPLEKLEIVRNGQIAASVPGDGKQTALTVSARLDEAESCWVAARTTAQRNEDEPEIQAHTNPGYILRQGRPLIVPEAQESVVKKWEAELAYYRAAGLPFANEEQRREFFDKAEQALKELKKPLAP